MKKLSIFTNNPRLLFDTVAIVLSMILMGFGTLIHEPSIHVWFWGFAFVIGGLSKAIEGVQKTISEKSLNVEFLMIAAASAAFFTGEYAEGAILIFIFGVSGVLEEFAMAQSEKALTNLLKIAPQTAILWNEEKEVIVSISNLVIGDRVLVKVGQQVPADGKITQGQASLNQSSITGEFIPAFKTQGDFVYAGSLVVDATIVVEVTNDPKQSVVQKMIAFVKRAQEEKTKTERQISFFEKIYVYAVILLSLAVIFITPVLGWLDASEAFRRGIIVLVVASPCALVASVTPAILSTLSHGAHKGILIKSGKYLEKTLGIDVVVLDKTGTITTGVPSVVAFNHLEKCDLSLLTSTIVNIERQSNHPLAKAIVASFPRQDVVSIKTQEIPGRGMSAVVHGQQWNIGRFDHKGESGIEADLRAAYERGETVVQVVRDHELIAYFSLKDTIRKSAIQAILQLKKMRIQSVMLTGDNDHTAKTIARDVGVSDYRGNCLPEDKVTYIQALKQQGKKVLMIGDGINDAPSLVTADLGVAMGSGTDVSLETADIIMMNDNLLHIPYLLRMAKHMQTIIRQNVVFSISVIMFLLVTNLFGFVVLRYGVLGHELSTILVIVNSLRMLSPRIRV